MSAVTHMTMPSVPTKPGIHSAKMMDCWLFTVPLYTTASIQHHQPMDAYRWRAPQPSHTHARAQPTAVAPRRPPTLHTPSDAPLPSPCG